MATIDLSTVPAKVTITNSGDHECSVAFFGSYQMKTLPAGDSLVIKADRSVELGYYLSLASGKLSVAYEAITDNSAE